MPGIPFFLAPQYADYFSEIILIVGKEEEKKEVLEFLKNLYDSGGTNVGFEYNTDLIASAKVISLESISQLDDVDMHTMKIEDLPSSKMDIMPTFEVTADILEKVQQAINKAGNISIDASEEFLKANPDFDEQKGYYGWAHICTSEVSVVTEALKKLKLASTYSDGVYYIRLEEYKTSNLELLEVGATAAADFLTQELGQRFYVRSKID